jgi:hypothetical protein
MRNVAFAGAALGATLVLSLYAAPAQAIPLTWVASNGTGSACTRAAPCATFQAAHDATDVRGEINCVDAGSYGQVDINKAISIVCDNTMATIVATGNGVSINVGAADIVTLKGLNIEGRNSALSGINFLSGGGALHVDKVQIRGFRGAFGIGLNFNPSAYAELYVTDSSITDNGPSGSLPFAGILLQPVASSSVNAFISRVRLENNNFGIFIDGGLTTGVAVNATVTDCAIIGSQNNGVTANTIAGKAAASIFLDHSVVSANFGSGVNANGATASGAGSAFVRIGDSTIVLNATGVSTTNAGIVQSMKNNRISGNLTDGTPIPAFVGPGGTALQ